MNPDAARRFTPWLLVVSGVLLEICYLSFYAARSGPGEVIHFIAVNVAAFLIVSIMLFFIRRSAAPLPRAWLLPVLLFGLLFRLTLIPHGIVGSDDIYRYLWDGDVAAAGINPFAYTPTDPHLAHIATDDLPSKVNHPELRSVYPALAQFLFLASHAMFGDQVWGMKLLIVLMDALTMIFIWLFVRGRPDPLSLASADPATMSENGRPRR